MIRAMKKLLSYMAIALCVGLSLISETAYAQEITVKGNVRDASGAPIIGAAVMVEGSSTGVVTDLDGNYSIRFRLKEGKTPALVFSSIS